MQYRTKDGKTVHVKMEGHLKQHLDVVPFLYEAFQKVELDGMEPSSFKKVTAEMGRVVGEQHCVSTTEDDEIVMAHRIGRRGPTRFVKNRKPIPSDKVTMVVRQNASGNNELVTAFIGASAPMEPWDRNIKTPTEQHESIEFWAHHALIWGSQDVVPRS